MAQTNTVYDPDSDEKKIPHRSPSEQELSEFRKAMGISAAEEAKIEQAGVEGAVSDIKDRDGSFFNPKDDSDKGGEEPSNNEATQPKTEGLYTPEDQDKKQVKKKKTKSRRRRWMIIGAGTGSLGLVLILVLLLLFANSLKIPNLAQNIESYEFARLTRQFESSADQVTDEDLEAAAVDAAYPDAVEQTDNLATSMIAKLKSFSPSQAIDNLGANQNLHMVVNSKGGISGTLDNQAFSMADEGFWTGKIPVLNDILHFRNSINFSSEFAPALEDALRTNEVGPIVRGIVANNIRQKLGIGLIAWYVGKYIGQNTDEARITEEGDKINKIDGGDTPPDSPGIVDELNNAESDVDTAAQQAESSTKGLSQIIDDGGVISGVRTAVSNALAATPFQTIVSIADPIAKFVTPACIIYDGSLNESTGFIDNASKQQESAFYYVASAADQQEEGSNFNVDQSGDGLANAVNATNDDIGDITQSNAYLRASGDTINTSNVTSAEASTDGQFTLFNAIPGIPGIMSSFLDRFGNAMCPALTSIYAQSILAAANLVVAIFGAGVSVDEVANIGDQVTNGIIENEGKSIIEGLLAKVIGDQAASYTSRAGELITDGVKNAIAIAGLTILAKLIVLDRSGEIDSGTAQGPDLANEADAGGNIQSNELERTQLFGRPLLQSEVCESNQDDQTFVADSESSQNAYNRYLSPSNPESLLSRTAIDISGQMNGSFVATLTRIGDDLLRPTTLLETISNMFFGKAFAAASCASPGNDVNTNYGEVQFGWSDAEENLIQSNDSYRPVENEQILAANPSTEATIAQTYAPCFGYIYNPVPNGTLDPTDPSGNSDLELEDGPGEAASLGTLLAGGKNMDVQYIVRDQYGNLLDQGICSPQNLGPSNPQYGDLVFRWRLEMRYDTTLDQLTDDQTTTGSSSSTGSGATASTPSSTTPTPTPPTTTPAQLDIDNAAGTQAAEQASTNGTNVGYALYSSGGSLLASYNNTYETYGASITKAMLLVAYLNQVGSGTVSQSAAANLTGMIEQSNDADANNVYHLLTDPATELNAVASKVGMTGFKLDTSDPLYVLGQSQITADDFAKFFSIINTLIPSSQLSFALNLLSNITPHAGLLNVLTGTVYSKEGWKPEPGPTNPFGQEGSPYIVNQAAQFSADGQTYGIAITVSGTTSEASGEVVIQNVAQALLPELQTQAGSTD